MSLEISSFLDDRRRVVEEALAAQVRRWEADVPPKLLEAMRSSLLGGGKRLRPVLGLAAFEACGGVRERERLVLDLAVALECIHTYSLIHDDLPAMDDDDLRRGRPTCHILHGEATAILAGDALLTEAFQILAGGEEFERLQLVGLVARAAGAAGMVGGQQLDLEVESRSLDGERPDLTTIERIHRGKTAALLTAAVVGGAICADATLVEIEALRAYGSALGLAFQITDDILDEVGDTAAMGKHGGSDRARGMPTYPVLLGLEGARDRALEAQALAVEALEGFGERGKTLRSLASYVVERTG